MPVDDNSIFIDLPEPPKEKKFLVPSTTRVIVYTTAMEEKREARFTENTVGGASPFADDVTETYKQITSAHLYKMSKEGQNKYSVSIGSVMSSQKIPGGFTAPIVDNATAAEKKFTDIYTQSTSADGQQAVNYLNADPEVIDVKIRKGKEFPSGPDIEQIYSEIKPNGNNSSGTVVDAINKTLSENNLSNPDNVYVKERSDFIEKNKAVTVGQLIVQPDFGKHSPRKFPNVNNSNIFNDELNAIHVEKLKTFAIQLLMKSSGENYSFNNEKKEIDTFTEDTYNELKKLFYSSKSPSPGAARIGLKIPVGRFAQTEVLENLNSNFVKPLNKTEIKSNDDEQIYSYGNVNSYLAPFDSLDISVSNVAGALLSSIIVNVIDNLTPNIGNEFKISTNHDYYESVMRGLEIFFDIDVEEIKKEIKKEEKKATKKDDKKDAKKKSASKKSKFDSDKSGQKIDEGNSKIKFGETKKKPSISNERTPPNISEISRYQQSPEYYNLIMRMLVREFNKEILSGISNPFFSVNVSSVTNQIQRSAGENEIQKPDVTNLTALDYNPKIGISSDVTNNYKAFINLKNSKLIGFLNTLAKIGDISLTREEISPEVSTTGGSNSSDVYSYTREASIVDTYTPPGTTDSEINPAALIYKTFLTPEASQLVGRTKTQAISNNTTPSRFILPETLLRSERRISADDASPKTSVLSNRNSVLSSSPRLQKTVVDEIEKKLDASYVPFYMDDLRTNEIISFHAFLESLSDNFSPRYSETEGYGRIDSVQTYTSTKRDISFDFTIVATNPEDFNEMWQKINKLTTMIYPQFTQGRQLQSSDGNKFIQPFSQLPGASPMIRLRIGDVVKSNFSGFNLARLFGIGETDEVFQINSTAANARIADEETNRQNLLTAIEGARSAMNLGFFSPGESFNIRFLFRGSFYTEQRNARRLSSGPDAIASEGLELISNDSSNDTETRRRQTRIINSLASVNAIVEVTDDSRLREEGIYKIRFKNPIPGNEIQQNDEFYLRIEFFEFSAMESEVLRVARSRVTTVTSPDSTITTSNATEVQNFLSKTENPIFKSFESARGKGLAGFITSLNFNWIEENIVWEVNGLNNRAPKLCKVKINFAPIHDIAPGIDSNGFNRAPIYPVGNLSTATSFDVDGAIDDPLDYQNRINQIRTRG